MTNKMMSTDERVAALERENVRYRQAFAELGRMLSSPYGGPRERARLYAKAPAVAEILTDVEAAPLERRAEVA